MALFDTWFAKLRRKALPKARQSVLTFDRYELMTATQALRFEELQSATFTEQMDQLKELPSQPWYSLSDACDALAISETELLNNAAAGTFNCFVYSKPGDVNRDLTASMAAEAPEFLALPTKNCRELAAEGVSDVNELHLNRPGRSGERVRLKRPQRVCLDTVYLKHPLPSL